MFDSNFNLVKSFGDPSIPSTFSVFGIQDINGMVYVTYAVPNVGAGGYVDIFKEDGTFVKTLIQGTAPESGLGHCPRSQQFWAAEQYAAGFKQLRRRHHQRIRSDQPVSLSARSETSSGDRLSSITSGESPSAAEPQTMEQPTNCSSPWVRAIGTSRIGRYLRIHRLQSNSLS